MSRPMRAILSVLATATGLAVAVAPAQAAPAPGAAGAGDPYFPRQGNGGYDVSHYRLNVSYRPTGHALSGTAYLTATADQDLSRFDLDLRRSLTADSVQIDGVAAQATQPASEVQELVITPATPIAKGTTFHITVHYAGKAKAVIDPDGSLDGFIPTDDGAFVASEPQGSPSWFPVNDTPADKATYDVSMTVPKGLSAIGNGRLVSISNGASTDTWRWYLGKPVSSYLITASIGKFDVTFDRTPSGIPYYLAVDPREEADSAPVLAKLPAIIDYYSSVYGAYPYGTAGAIVDHAPNIGYALETATRPLFDRAPDELTLAHELAHQWYGDDVTLTRWRGIWLNEGFAEFSSWLWDEHRGGTSGAHHLDELLNLPATSRIWSPPPASPGSGEFIFSGSVYERGAGTLQALREKLGDTTFFRIMHGWVAAHAYGNATVGEFTAYAAAVSHQDLDSFFYQWLFRKGKPWTPNPSTSADPARRAVRR